MHRMATLGLSLLVAGGVVACSGGSSSPVSPSARQSGGTTISGTALTPGAVAPSLGRLATDGSETLRVCVVGSGVCVDVDGAGGFELSGDFAGDVQLQFSGSGHDVVVTVHNVQPGQTITVTVTLSGDTGTLQVESREDGTTSDNADGGAKILLCHLEGNGSYHLIEVDASAEDDHMAHGDVDAADLMFDDNCGILPEVEIAEEEAEPEDGNDKVELCHLEGNGSYHLIEVDTSAEDDHIAHGDVPPEGDGTCPISLSD